MKQFSPACERNREPILAALQRLLPPSGNALEIASGTGQHVVHFAQHLPGWQWQPSDWSADGFASIAAWCHEVAASNVAPPVLLDVMAPHWPAPGGPLQTAPHHAFSQAFDLIYCANMLHIAPWATCAALMQGAARYLAPNGLLVTYGPYLEHDVPTSPGNLAFDHTLRMQNPAWGIRALADVAAQAGQAGLVLKERVAMPANNLLLVFGRPPAR